jgi:hypothetical protein
MANQKPQSKLRRTDNTMATRRRTKGQTVIYKIMYRILKIEQNESPLIGEEL